MIKGYFIQYKFILPKTIKHSSYTYQKLFRAIHGYTQTVCKSTKKKYKYHRKGLLSETPYIRPGKNCVIIPKKSIQLLTKFFQTGVNPTHKWRTKGDWKASYYMDEKKLGVKEVEKAIISLMKRISVSLKKKSKETLYEIIVQNKTQEMALLKPFEKQLILNELKKVVENEWFKEGLKESNVLQQIKNYFNKLQT